MRPILANLAGLGLAAMVPLAHAALPIDEDQARVLVEAVQSATALDLYNARCRSDSSGRYLDNLNKALVSRLRLTVITVQDDFFPERSFRQAQQRMQEAFQQTLKDAGGCKGAKESGLPNQMQTHHQELLGEIDRWP